MKPASAQDLLDRFHKKRLREVDQKRLDALATLCGKFHRDVAAFLWKVQPDTASVMLDELKAAGLVRRIGSVYWQIARRKA